ncbi:gamma-glutamyltranspeptidase/glutathione hydrolase [Dietzia sp. 2505]|uniref:gamma-glutamyltransferase family protein n=1 Tax=Dietzia sp. 2505 TaxID=3156457 RepID=UPI003393A381
MTAPKRPAALAGEAMVSSSHPRVSATGLRVLEDGGNAVDAALAMAAMSWLTLPGQCGIGGDAFAVVREPDGQVWTVNGSGFGPDGGTADFYRELGLSALPLDGALAVAVPGGVAAMAAMAARGGSRDLAELWEPAAAAAERGLPCSSKTARDLTVALGGIRDDPGMTNVFLRDARVPGVGDPLGQPELAATIRATAADPLGFFYAGEFADRAVRHLRDGGAPFTGDEWSAQVTTTTEESISAKYAGAVIHQTPVPSAGWMVLQQALLCDNAVGFEPWLSAGAIDRLARSARKAFQDRYAFCGSDTDRWSTTLSPAEVRAGRGRLDERSEQRPFVTSEGDTTSMVAVDGEGRAVSFIHSLAFTFGAKIVIPGTGVVLNNRLGRGAYLLDGHPNEVKPRRKPLHTLNAWVATDTAGRLLHVGNTPGGDGQVQWNMQILSHLLDHGLDAQEAVSAPRFTVYPGSDADTVGDEPELRYESRLGGEVIRQLRAMGHSVRGQGEWGAEGSAQVISVDRERGLLTGGCDPRQEGVSLGW